MSDGKIMERSAAADWVLAQRAGGRKVVFTNGCFDILHAGHVELLQAAKKLGDCLVVGINSDASVRALKGEQRPINAQGERAAVLAALQAVDAVTVFEEETPIPLLKELRPAVHVKGGDYTADELPESATIKEQGGEIVIVPLKAGFSTTSTLEKLRSEKPHKKTECVIVIPARYGSTRFPGKPLADLGGKTVIERTVEAALQTSARRPILVATDDERIAKKVREGFSEEEAVPVMTSKNCQTGTDRLAEVVRARFIEELNRRLVIVNIQGDEPFVRAAHLEALMAAMQNETESTLKMATLASPLEASDVEETNVVKVVLDRDGDALYFSRLPIPFARDLERQEQLPRLRHLGVYAYEANWLLEMAALPPSPLEEAEQLEQLRALESGTKIRVVQVEDVIPIAIDTPEDLEIARRFWNENCV